MIPPTVKVITNPLGVDVTAVAEDDTLLSLIELNIRISRYCLTGYGVVVEKALNRLTVAEVRSNNVSRVIRLDMGIEGAVGFYHDIRALLAEAVTAGKVNLGSRYTLFLQFCFESLIDSVAATRDASGTPADKYPALSRHITPSRSFQIIGLPSWDSYLHVFPG
ncbi:hypothetical protein ES703_65991 [subsurface metagenome]